MSKKNTKPATVVMTADEVMRRDLAALKAKMDARKVVVKKGA